MCAGFHVTSINFEFKVLQKESVHNKDSLALASKVLRAGESAVATMINQEQCFKTIFGGVWLMAQEVKEKEVVMSAIPND